MHLNECVLVFAYVRKSNSNTHTHTVNIFIDDQWFKTLCCWSIFSIVCPSFSICRLVLSLSRFYDYSSILFKFKSINIQNGLCRTTISPPPSLPAAACLLLFFFIQLNRINLNDCIKRHHHQNNQNRHCTVWENETGTGGHYSSYSQCVMNTQYVYIYSDIEIKHYNQNVYMQIKYACSYIRKLWSISAFGLITCCWLQL